MVKDLLQQSFRRTSFQNIWYHNGCLSTLEMRVVSPTWDGNTKPKSWGLHTQKYTQHNTLSFAVNTDRLIGSRQENDQGEVSKIMCFVQWKMASNDWGIYCIQQQQKQ